MCIETTYIYRKCGHPVTTQTNETPVNGQYTCGGATLNDTKAGRIGFRRECSRYKLIVRKMVVGEGYCGKCERERVREE